MIMMMRKADLRDIANTYSLTNEVRTEINYPLVAFDEHKEWFLNRILSDDSFFILEDKGGNFIGQIRIDRKNDENEINLSIVKAKRGKGYGSLALKWLLEINKMCKAVAYIRDDNIHSIKLFEKMGFKKFSDSKKMEIACKQYFISSYIFEYDGT
jgi:RimJ/RimL family protein N-acetyltransferase